MAVHVRYVNSSSGMNVRSTAAGTKITALNNGDLMNGLRFTIISQMMLRPKAMAG